MATHARLAAWSGRTSTAAGARWRAPRRWSATAGPCWCCATCSTASAASTTSPPTSASPATCSPGGSPRSSTRGSSSGCPTGSRGARERHEYRLTAAGRDLRPVLLAMLAWGDAHRAGPRRAAGAGRAPRVRRRRARRAALRRGPRRRPARPAALGADRLRLNTAAARCAAPRRGILPSPVPPHAGCVRPGCRLGWGRYTDRRRSAGDGTGFPAGRDRQPGRARDAADQRGAGVERTGPRAAAHDRALHRRRPRAMFVRDADEAVLLGPDDPDTWARQPYLDYAELRAGPARRRADAVWPGWGFVAEKAEFAELCRDLGSCSSARPPRSWRGSATRSPPRCWPSRSACRWRRGAAGRSPTSRRPASTPQPSATRSWSRRPRAAAAAASAGSSGPRSWTRRSSAPPRRRAKTAGRRHGVHGAGDRGRPARRGAGRRRRARRRCGRWACGTARVQRRNQKVLEESGSTGAGRRAGAAAARARRRAGQGRRATSTPARSSSSTSRRSGCCRLPGGQHPAAGGAPGHRGHHRRSTSSSCSCTSRPAGSWRRSPRRRRRRRGHAIEARLTAEDPEQGFAPAPGLIEHLAPARRARRPGRHRGGGGRRHPAAVRLDDRQGHRLGPGPRRGPGPASRALRQTTAVIDGGTTNKAFLLDLLDRPEVVSGDVDTSWLDRDDGRRATPRRGAPTSPCSPAAIEAQDAHVAAAARAAVRLRRARPSRGRARDVAPGRRAGRAARPTGCGWPGPAAPLPRGARRPVASTSTSSAPAGSSAGWPSASTDVRGAVGAAGHRTTSSRSTAPCTASPAARPGWSARRRRRWSWRSRSSAGRRGDGGRRRRRRGEHEAGDGAAGAGRRPGAEVLVAPTPRSRAAPSWCGWSPTPDDAPGDGVAEQRVAGRAGHAAGRGRRRHAPWPPTRWPRCATSCSATTSTSRRPRRCWPRWPPPGRTCRADDPTVLAGELAILRIFADLCALSRNRRGPEDEEPADGRPGGRGGPQPAGVPLRLPALPRRRRRGAARVVPGQAAPGAGPLRGHRPGAVARRWPPALYRMFLAHRRATAHVPVVSELLQWRLRHPESLPADARDALPAGASTTWSRPPSCGTRWSATWPGGSATAASTPR